MHPTASAAVSTPTARYATTGTETDATDLITRTADFDSCLAENNGRLCPCGHILSEVNALSVECEGYEYMDEAFMADCTDTHHFMMCTTRRRCHGRARRLCRVTDTRLCMLEQALRRPCLRTASWNA